MKKILCFLLLLTLLLSFVGCQNEDVLPSTSLSASMDLGITSHLGFSLMRIKEFEDTFYEEIYDESAPSYREIEALGQTFQLDYKYTVLNPIGDQNLQVYSVRNSGPDWLKYYVFFDGKGDLVQVSFEPGYPFPVAENITPELLREQVEDFLSDYIDFSHFNDFKCSEWKVEEEDVTARLEWFQTRNGIKTLNSASVMIRDGHLNFWRNFVICEVPEDIQFPEEKSLSIFRERLEAECVETDFALIDFEITYKDITTFNGEFVFRVFLDVDYKRVSTGETVRDPLRLYLLFPDEIE